MAQFQIYQSVQDREQCWKWRFLDEGNAVVAKSEATFIKEGVVDAIKKVRVGVEHARVVSTAESEKVDGFRFVYQDDDKGREWCLRDDKDEIIITGKVDDAEVDLKVYLENLCKKFQDGETTWEDDKNDPAHPDKTADQTKTRGFAGS